MLDSKGRLVNCAQCGHGNWVYVLRQPDTYACQRHGWEARCTVVDMKFLKRDSATWKKAWAALQAKYPGENGEPHVGWQYMGTVIKESNEEEGISKQAEHQFRHREFPGNGGNRTHFNAYTLVDGYDDYQ